VSEREPMTMSISPEPSPEELAVIVSAVTAAIWGRTPALPNDAASDRPQSSRWARQGRAEAMRGLDREDAAFNPGRAP